MKNSHWLRSAALAFGMLAAALTAVGAQTNSRGQPTTAFSAADFAKLRWLEGAWKGTSADEAPIFARYHFSNDSTVDVTYFADSLTGRQAGVARLNLSVGRVYFTLGPGRWGATRIDARGLYLVPQVNAHNTYDWAYGSNSAWTSTLHTGMGGKERTIVYAMTRLTP